MIFRGIKTLYTFQGIAAKDGRGVTDADFTPIPRAAMVVDKGVVRWVGPERRLPREFRKHRDVDLKGQNVYPAFLDPHTHLIYAGDRAEEFEWRNSGVSYQEIAARGGGILSTMTKTRKASPAKLRAEAEKRVRELVNQGVTTIEVKSGYALNLKDEVKCLKVAAELGPARIVPTFLGAHARPPEFKTTPEYLKYLAESVLPVIRRKKLADRVDIFVEKGFFESADSRAYLARARELGFQITIHADQITLSGGSELGLELGALSIDHVIQIDDALIEKIARTNITPVLLPAADLYMKCAYPPARALIDRGARVALATDHNPGTSPTLDLQLVGLLARLQMKMTLPEVFSAFTFGAAAALGLSDTLGSLEPGKNADFFATGAAPTDHFYAAGARLEPQVFREGRRIDS